MQKFILRVITRCPEGLVRGRTACRLASNSFEMARPVVGLLYAKQEVKHLCLNSAGSSASARRSAATSSYSAAIFYNAPTRRALLRLSHPRRSKNFGDGDSLPPDLRQPEHTICRLAVSALSVN
jgi:hypothetical protein